jgi:methionine aminopeptidase
MMKIKIKDLRKVILQETKKLHEADRNAANDKKKLSVIRDALAKAAAALDGDEDEMQAFDPELAETLRTAFEAVYGAHVAVENAIDKVSDKISMNKASSGITDSSEHSPLKKKFMKGVELYTGEQVKEMQIHPDPKVADTYALRAKMANGMTIDFVIVGRHAPAGSVNAMTPEDVSDALEENNFDSWPPRSR